MTDGTLSHLPALQLEDALHRVLLDVEQAGHRPVAERRFLLDQSLQSWYRKFEQAAKWRIRAGTGNLNKPLSGESATFDCPTGRGNGAEDGKKNETDALSGVQSKSGVSGLGGRQHAGRTGAAI